MKYKLESDIRKELINIQKNCFIQPIESATSLGIPDLFVMAPLNGEIWCELKLIKRVVVHTVSPKWEKGQISWAKNYIRHKGFWVLVISVNDKLLYSIEPKEQYHISELKPFVSFSSEMY